MINQDLQVTGTTPAVDGYQVEVNDTKHGFRFRLRHIPTDRVTHWAGYQSIVMLDDIAATTGYYGGAGEDLVPRSAADILRQFAVQDVTIKFGDEFTEAGDAVADAKVSLLDTDEVEEMQQSFTESLAGALRGSGDLLENMSDDDFAAGMKAFDAATPLTKKN
ncbi:hypothetical protein Voja6_00058 [Pseudomonas phage vB_PpuM-Voja-6]